MKYSNKRKNSKQKYLKIKVDRSYAIAESERSVLFKIGYKGKNYKLWINKVGIFPSEFTNILSISLVDSPKFKYSLYKEENDNWKKPNLQVSGRELFELYEEDEMASYVDWEDDLEDEEDEEYEDDLDEEYEDEEVESKHAVKKTTKKVRAIK